MFKKEESHGPIPEGYKLFEEGEIIEPGDMFWCAHGKGWRSLNYMFGEKKPSHWADVLIKRIKQPTISTMEHQDGATTTTVSFGGVGSKFEKNGREYEVTNETEVAHSNGLRQIEIKAVSRPTYGQSPVKPAMDAMEKMWPSFKDLMLQDPLLFLKTKPSKQAADALDAVAEASEILDNRPSIFDAPVFKEAARKHLEEREARKKVFEPWTREFRKVRKHEIQSIVRSVVEKLQ